VIKLIEIPVLESFFMRKIIKTKIREYKPNGEFLRFNLPPVDLPDDCVIRWIGQNEEFGVVEIITEREIELKESIDKHPLIEEITDFDISELPPIDEDLKDNVVEGGDYKKALKIKKKYSDEIRSKNVNK